MFRAWIRWGKAQHALIMLKEGWMRPRGMGHYHAAVAVNSSQPPEDDAGILQRGGKLDYDVPGKMMILGGHPASFDNTF